MAKYAVHWTYLTNIRKNLIRAGVLGISQHELNQATRTKYFGSNDLLDALHEWETRDWVQCFRVEGMRTRQKATMWRATTKLRDEWSNLSTTAPLHLEDADPNEKYPEEEKPVEEEEPIVYWVRQMEEKG